MNVERLKARQHKGCRELSPTDLIPQVPFIFFHANDCQPIDQLGISDALTGHLASDQVPGT